MNRFWLCATLAWLLGACASPLAMPSVSEADSVEMREHPERLIIVALANPGHVVTTQAGSTLGNYAATQRYAASSSARATLTALKDDYGLRELAAWPIAALRLHCVVLEVAAGAAQDAVVASLAKDRRVEIAQPLQTFSTLAEPEVKYNDPYVDLQRGFVQVEAALAHRVSRGSGVNVAIIDTGVDTSHPDLRGRIATTRNFVDADEAQFDRDRHGTEVAGIIAAVANNRQGIVGIAPEAKLTIYKACWHPKTGDGSARCNSFTLAQALGASIDGAARIINLSLGGPADELLGRLLALALKQGSIVIGAMPAAGSQVGFPAGVAGVIMVDSAGRAHTGKDLLQAPGRDILTLQPGGRYDFDSGSSLAAAHVTAVAALLLGAEPSMDRERVRSLLKRGEATTEVGVSINACGALAELGKSVFCRLPRAASRDAGARDAVLLH